MNHLLEVNELCLFFGGVKAVNQVTFYLEKEELLGIIGPNGSGKTSLFNAITGIYKPTSGTVYLNGENITGKPLFDMVRYGIARTFQNLRSFRGMTVLENVMMGNYINDDSNTFDALFHTNKYKINEKISREKALSLLELVGIDNFKNEYVSSLPYGIQKRVELCRALIVSPKILLLDEPTAGLNTNEANMLIENVQTVKEEKNLSIIMIEHNMKVMMASAERVIAMDSGEILAVGKPNEIQNNNLVIESYLGKGSKN